MAHDEDDWTESLDVPRRTVLRAMGAGAGLSVAGGQATAAVGSGAGDDEWHPMSPTGAPGIDPLFGWASGGPNPCMGDAPADCVEEAHPSITVDREVEVRIDLPGLAFAAGSQGVLSEETTQSINEAVRDGTVDRSVLRKPDESVEIQGPDGPTSATVEEIAESLVSGIGFYFEPAGIHLTPGETVLFSAETPDHAVAAFHERHGRQNRVPDGVGPFASPLIPVGGYWLQRFRRPGVYDYYCPPHQVFGMVGTIVVAGESADAPSRSVEDTGRPPTTENLLSEIIGGLDPNLPSSMEALETDALSPENVKAEGWVSWQDVVDEHRGSGDE